MSINDDLYAEIKLLAQFNPNSIQEGVKVHGNAAPEMIQAAERLYSKGMISQPDGGYLTDLGVELVDHIQKVLLTLKGQF
jgi:uncharacterized protein (TIGR02647 family)